MGAEPTYLPFFAEARGARDRRALAGPLALYLFLIALPLTGWYAASRLGVPVTFFGLGPPCTRDAGQGPSGLITEPHENAGINLLNVAGTPNGALASIRPARRHPAAHEPA